MTSQMLDGLAFHPKKYRQVNITGAENTPQIPTSYRDPEAGGGPAEVTLVTSDFRECVTELTIRYR